jgi:hypothetical protein
MSKILLEYTVKGNCTSKGFTDKKSSSNVKPVWFESDVVNYEYCQDGIGSNQRYYRKKKTVTPTLTPEEKLKRAKKCGHSTWDEYKNSGWKCKESKPDPDGDVTPTPSPVTGRYRDCTGGPYTIGCTDTEGIIRKVQGCLGTTVDGKFWVKTEEALNTKTDKNSFTKEEADEICSGKLDDKGSSGKLDDKGSTKPFDVEEQRTYWQELKDNKQITDRGVIVSIKNEDKITYVFKQNKDTKVKEPITRQDIDWSTPEKRDELMKNFETYDYVVLFPVDPNDPKGKKGDVEVITAVIDDNGEKTIDRVKAGSWSPSEKKSSFGDDGDLVAETINKILSRRLVEQNVTLTRGSSPDPKGGTYSGGQTTSGGNQSTTSGGKQQSATSGGNQSTTSGGQQQSVDSPNNTQTKSIDPEVKEIVESNGYTFDKPSLKDIELLATKTTVGELFKKLDQGGVYKDYYNDNTPIWKTSTVETEKVDVNQLIRTANSANTKREEKRKVCKSVVKQLYYRAFKSKRVIQYKDFKDIDSKTLQGLKDVVIKCDQEKNFVQGDFGVRDELKALYSCYQQGKDKRESHGVSKYCLTGYLNDVKGTPGMQRESVVNKHIIQAINNKKKDVMVESILKQIKSTRR